MIGNRGRASLFAGIVAAVTAFAGCAAAHAQATGPSVDVCSSGTIDGNYSDDTVEQTVCLYGNASGLDAYNEVDLEQYTQQAYIVEVGADAQVYGPSGLVSDSGEQQGYDVSVSGWVPSPLIGSWYGLNGLYDECYDPSYAGNPCSGNWSGLMEGYSASVMVTSPPTPTLTVSTSGTPSNSGQAVTFTATISSGPTGSITFYDGGAAIGTATISGTTAQLTDSSLAAGSHSITAAWPGNSSYGAATSSPVTQAVNSNVIYSYSIGAAGLASGYAANGDLLAYTDSVNGTWSFVNGYDNLDRLVSGSATAGYYSGVTTNWSYDSFGNRTSESFGGSSNVALPTSSSAQYSDGTNRVTASSLMSGNPLPYDASGDVQQDNQNAYLYDAEGRVCASQPVSQGSPSGPVTGYVYDAEGNRVAKGTFSSWPSSCPAPTSANGFTLTTTYVLGPGGEQVSELNGSGAWQHTNVYAGGALIATYEQNGGSQPLYFQLTDWLGTKRVQTDYAGANPETCTSLPFGNGLSCAGTADATEHHFTGKVRDAETGFANGNDYFGARYFESTFGRFMSPDWSAKIEPVPYSKLDNPQTLNLYAYVGNNPLSDVDADGHGALAPTETPGTTRDPTPNPRGALYADGVRSGQHQEERTDRAQLTIANVAESQFASTAYEYDKSNGSYRAGTNKCNKGVADWIQEAGLPRPQVKKSGILGWLGFTRDPTAKEWATIPIAGWSAPDSAANARVGDVIAVGHTYDNEGHVGIVVAPGYASASVSAKTHPAGIVVVNGWGFRPAGYNEEGGSRVVVRHYLGDGQ